MAEALGYTLDDVKSWDDDLTNLVFKDDVETVKHELEKYNELEDEADYAFDCRFNHKEGDWRYFRTRGMVLRRDEMGKAASLLFVAEDVTEKMQFRQEVTALKELIDDTESMLHFGSWSWDVSVNKLYWTDGMYKLLGYSKRRYSIKG